MNLPQRPSLSILQPTQPPSSDSLSPTEPSPTPSSLSRASSAKSTSSVQAVPIKVPIRSSPTKLPSSSSIQSHSPGSIPQFVLSTSSSSVHPSSFIQSVSETRSNSQHISPLPASFQKLSIAPALKPQSDSSIHSSVSSYPPSSDQPLVDCLNPAPPNASQTPKKIQDLIVGDVLGEGSYSTVYHVVDKSTQQKAYALKVLDKRHVQKEKKVKYVAIERDCLNLLHYHPGCITLFSTFQDEFSLYYLLEFVPNGEILKLIKLLGSLSTNCVIFYSAQILTAIEHMHNRGVIHRDIKPENILLDSKMRIKIADYGSAKILVNQQQQSTSTTTDTNSNVNTNNDPPTDTKRQRSHSFVGTADYVSPELLTNKVTCKNSDLWAFGCVLFQMIAGIPPFRARSEYLTFQKITNLEYNFPEGFPSDAKDLVAKLLVLDPDDRLSIDQIKAHQFYQSVDWDTIWEIDPPVLQPGLVNLSIQPNHLISPPNPSPTMPTQIPTAMPTGYPIQPFYQEPTPHTPILEPDPPPLSSIGEEEDNRLETDDAPVSGLGRTVNKRTSWLLNPRKKFKDDDPVASNSNGMTWVEIFLPNELMVYSSPVNELIVNQEEISHQNNHSNTNINEKIKSFTRTISQTKRKKKKRVLILTNFPRLLCVKEDEKKSSKVRIKYEILFKPLPTMTSTPISTVTTPKEGERSGSLEGPNLVNPSACSQSSSVSPPSLIPTTGSHHHLLPKHHQFLLFKKIEMVDHTSFKIETVKSTSTINVPANYSYSNNKNVQQPSVMILRFEDKSNDDDNEVITNNDVGQLNQNINDHHLHGSVKRWCDEIDLAFRLANHLVHHHPSPHD